AINQVSNALGVINPIESIIEKAKKVGAWTLIDAAQSSPHLSIDVQKLDCDFLVFSGHKMYAPTGVGILYGKEKVDRKSTRLNSSHVKISYAVFCLKKKTKR